MIVSHLRADTVHRMLLRCTRARIHIENITPREGNPQQIGGNERSFHLMKVGWIVGKFGWSSDLEDWNIVDSRGDGAIHPCLVCPTSLHPTLAVGWTRPAWSQLLRPQDQHSAPANSLCCLHKDRRRRALSEIAVSPDETPFEFPLSSVTLITVPFLEISES